MWTRGAGASGCKPLLCSLTLCPTTGDKQDAPARCGLDLHFLASRSKELRFWYLQQLCVPGTDLHHTQPSMVMRVKGPVPAVSCPHLTLSAGVVLGTDLLGAVWQEDHYRFQVNTVLFYGARVSLCCSSGWPGTHSLPRVRQ